MTSPTSVSEARTSRLRALFQRELAHINGELEQATGRLGLFELGALIVGALGLTVMNFLSLSEVYMWLWGGVISPSSDYWELGHLAHWVGACVLGYLILPMCYLKLTKRQLRDYYWDPRPALKHAWLYALLLSVVTGVVWWVSRWPDFQHIYPFYSLAGRSYLDLIAWELLYGLQFLSLEFFFRSFLLESFRRALSYGAVAFMLIPYCMIHFQKTAAESLGSIIAGLILGYLAMRSRSLWGGVLIHWLVAIEMDVMSLFQKGELPPLP